MDGRELRELIDDALWSMEQETGVGLGQHRRVVVRITGCDDPVVQTVQGLDGASLLVWHPQPVVDDSVVGDDQAMADQGRETELPHQRLTELLERVRQQQDLGPGAESIEELACAVERREATDDIGDHRH